MLKVQCHFNMFLPGVQSSGHALADHNGRGLSSTHGANVDASAPSMLRSRLIEKMMQCVVRASQLHKAKVSAKASTMAVDQLSKTLKMAKSALPKGYSQQVHFKCQPSMLLALCPPSTMRG